MMLEDDFFARLFGEIGQMPPEINIPPGDDCAGWLDGEVQWLATVDQLVAGRHYVLEADNLETAARAGKKLVSRNLSDIAAMGAKPRFALLAVGRQAGCSDEWLRTFYTGALAQCRRFGVAMIGGDLATLPKDSVSSLTLIGSCTPGKAICRKGAKPGDKIFVTGRFGDSFPTEHHLDFEPRCPEAQWLADNFLANAMIDISDGLQIDAFRLAKSSSVRIIINTDLIPLRTQQTSICGALSDGEDYELLFSVSPENCQILLRDWDFSETLLTEIGYCETGSPDVVDLSGNSLTELFIGYDHLRDG